MTVSKKLRFQILNRDNFECKYCWLKAGRWVQLQVDHIIPKSKWWLDSIENLITSCYECNIWKWSELLNNGNIYKEKIKNNIKVQKSLFYDYWNNNRYWTIDDDTRTLISMYYEESMWKESYEEWVSYPPIAHSFFPWVKDISVFENEFKKWETFCDWVLSIMNEHHTLYIGGEYNWLYIDDIEEESRWVKWTDFVSRLNYVLWESLFEDCIEENKSTYHLMKFCRFYNEIENKITKLWN